MTNIKSIVWPITFNTILPKEFLKFEFKLSAMIEFFVTNEDKDTL